MLVWTAPKGGYKSVSMINLGFLSYSADYLPDKYFNRILTLAAPYVPLDGMNEKGLSIGVLQIMDEATDQNSEKQDVTTTVMIRAVLDKAADVPEAIEIFKSFDMHDSVGSCYHYQIADKSGNSAIIEYVDNEMKVIYPENEGENGFKYQAAANFYLTEGVDDPDGFGQDRYQIMMNKLNETQGILNINEAMNLLEAAKIESKIWEDGWEDKTQWSIVYDLNELKINISVGMNYNTVYSASLYEEGIIR